MYSVNSCFNKNDFLKPQSRFYPAFAWMWNVPITKDGIISQLDMFEKSNVLSFYVIPCPPEFRPKSMRAEMSPEYLSDNFFRLISFATEEAEKRGMTMWLYDEGGYPSGGACGNVIKEYPNAAAKKVAKREITLKKGEIYRPLNDVLCSFSNRKRVYKGFTSTCEATICEYFPEEYIPNGNVVGLTDKKTTETFINLTHERYASFVSDRFGNLIPLIFTDEPRMYLPLWNDEIKKEFETVFGYDILDYMPVIFDETLAATDDDRHAIINYNKICAELFVRNFMHPLREWCDAHGVALSGHLDKDNTPDYSTKLGYGSHVHVLSEMHIPGVDTIWQQIFPNKNEGPTSEGSGFFPRVASSAASIGSSLALSESFAVYGDGLTQDEMRYVVNFQFARGINIFNFMSVSYGLENAHSLCMRPSFSADKPGFFARADFNKYVARTEVIMQTGRRTADTLLYHPQGDIALGGEAADKALASYEANGLMLEEKFIDFDITDEFMLKKAQIEDGKIVLGAAKYSHLVLPECKFVPDFVRKLANEFNGTGEPLIECENESVRVSRRTCDNGDLIYFIFNQSTEKITSGAVLRGAESKNVFRLHPENGFITREESENVYFSLSSGDAAIYLVTDAELETDDYADTFEAKLGNTVKTHVVSYHFDNGKVALRDESSDFEYDETFSGEVTYELDYEFAEKPKKGGICRLAFDAPGLSAEIFIDGEKCGTCGTTPLQIFIPSEKFGKCGKIGIRLSNTLGNDIVKQSDKIAEKYGNIVNMEYHRRSVEFEKRSAVMSKPQNISLTLTLKK